MALPPGPRAPGLVNLVRFGRSPLEMLRRWHVRYGDLITVRMTGFGTGVYVADPDAIRELFTGDQSDLRAGEANSFMEPVLGSHSVLVLDGREPLRQRKLLLPPFQGSRVAAFREVIREVAEREVAGWQPGTQLVLRERMRSLTFEVICRAVFGVTEHARVERLREKLVAVIDSSPIFMLASAARADLGPLSLGGRFTRRLRAADALLYEEIQRRRKEPDLEERSDVLSLLLRARDDQDQAMTDAELRDELFTMLGAGHETTATGLAFAFELLLRNPPVLARLRDELERGDDDAYLDAVVKETLRLARSRAGSVPPASRSTLGSRWCTCARTSTHGRTSSAPSASSTTAPSRTRGFPSVAASAAASARRWLTPRWRRCCASWCRPSSFVRRATVPTRSCCAASRSRPSTASRSRCSDAWPRRPEGLPRFTLREL
jgi:cytochrome P450